MLWAASEIERTSARDASLREEISRLRTTIDGASWTLRAIKEYDKEIGGITSLIRYIQARNDMLIEAAGPAIAATANQLLTDAYGPRFSIRIVTQRKLANGNLAETFEISVLDADAGLESSVLHKSGGESVWLDKALTEAVAIYHQGLADVRYECIFADEAEDGLTAERKSQYFRMDKAAMDLGVRAKILRLAPSGCLGVRRLRHRHGISQGGCMSKLRRLRKLYKQIPAFECREGCTDCCGIVPFTGLELSQAKDVRKATGIHCPYAVGGRCEIYENRPMICRLFGASEEKRLQCPHGCRPETQLTKAQTDDLMQAYFAIDGRPGLPTINV